MKILIPFFSLFLLLYGFYTGEVYAAQKLFGLQEKQSSNLIPFPKWKDALERYSYQESKKESCKGTIFNRCYMEEWNDFVSDLKGKNRISQIREVNSYINEAPYIIDPINWGVEDYWAVPQQFFVKDGDCEDYAIAKYMTLKKLGIPSEKMRIVVLMDSNLNVYHSVLAVYENNRIYILDNQTANVLEDWQIHHYKPVYSISENYWWRHY